jgi:hypothetical protein
LKNIIAKSRGISRPYTLRMVAVSSNEVMLSPTVPRRPEPWLRSYSWPAGSNAGSVPLAARFDG